MSKYWNELLRHWRSGLTDKTVRYGTNHTINYVDENSALYAWLCRSYWGSNTLMDTCRSKFGGPNPCDPCGVDAYVRMTHMKNVFRLPIVENKLQFHHVLTAACIISYTRCTEVTVSLTRYTVRSSPQNVFSVQIWANYRHRDRTYCS